MTTTRSSIGRLDYEASVQVRQVLASMGRTEDIRFSPDLRQLAIACFAGDRIVLLDVDIRTTACGKQIHLTAARVLTSPDLHGPHGLDFMDAQTLIVANRNGSVCQFRLPASAQGSSGEFALASSASLDCTLVDTPGSVAIRHRDAAHCELLVCNNYRHTVGRLQLSGRDGLQAPQAEVLLHKWLDIPDGISTGRSQRWIAVSNHGLHAGMLYRSSMASPDADPQALLLGAHYPHGVRISADDRFILLADAGTPFVHLYHCPDADWQGVHYPRCSLRVMDASGFLGGRYSPQEGGPKGLDLHQPESLLVTTCEAQPLAFFDIGPLLQAGHAKGEGEGIQPVSADPPACAEFAQDVRFELERLQRLADAERAMPLLQAILHSQTWRLSAPFRDLGSLVKRCLAAASRLWDGDRK